jgi:hypothetical protein
MDDEVLAGLAPLVGVVLAGEDEGVDNALAVDGQGRLVGVFLDDREEVREQLALDLGEIVRSLYEELSVLVLRPPDGPPLDEVRQLFGVRVGTREGG